MRKIQKKNGIKRVYKSKGWSVELRKLVFERLDSEIYSVRFGSNGKGGTSTDRMQIAFVRLIVVHDCLTVTGQSAMAWLD